MVRRGLKFIARNTLLTVLAILFTALDIQPATLYAVNFSFPNLVYCLFCAWILHTSKGPSLAMVLVTFCVLEIVYGLPPGLWTALMLVATEIVRAKGPRLAAFHFIAEWALVAGLFAAALLLFQLVLLLTFSQAMTTFAISSYLVTTTISYPIIVALTAIMFRIGKGSETQYR